MKQKKPGKKVFWTKRKIVFAVWLVIFLVSFFVIKGMLLKRINEQLTEAFSGLSQGRIVRVEVDFSIFRLVDFLKTGSALASALSEPGKTVLEELVLKQPDIELTPSGSGKWIMALKLDGIESQVGKGTRLMTRTEIRDARLTLSSGQDEKLVFEPFSFQIEPSSSNPSQQLSYDIKGNSTTTSFHILGEAKPDNRGQIQFTGDVTIDQFPLESVRPSFPRLLKEIILGGTFSLDGHFETNFQSFSYNGEFACEALSLQPGKVTQEYLRQRLEAVDQAGRIPTKQVRIQVPLNDPKYRWEIPLATILN